MQLSKTHLQFAKNARGINSWRQKVSRGYYACYCASRALRLFKSSEYNKKSDDHERISYLPDDLKDVAIWKNLLKTFRGDRNIADYDHIAKESDLEKNARTYVLKAEEFHNLVKEYIKANA